MRVAVVGQGYVGLPISMRAVESGHDVVGYDIDADRVAKLKAGASYIDDVHRDVVQTALATGRFEPTCDENSLDRFDVAVVTVPTPLRDGVPDLSYVDASAQTLARFLEPGATVIVESTTYPGTTVDRVQPVLEAESGLRAGADFHLGYSPERIDPGNPTWRFDNTPKVISGIDEPSLEAIRAFYGTMVETTVAVSSPDVAELAKILENTFRHVNIALVNELAMHASDLGVDVWEAIEAASTKPFGFMRFTPGPGVGGHCLPVDPSYLSWMVKQSLGFPFRFVELANDINDHMPDYVVRRIGEMLNREGRPVKGTRILVLGLAYKRNSGDAREAPGPIICERLTRLGARVTVVDPHLADRQFPPSTVPGELTESTLAAADLVVIVTDHDAFDWDLVAKHARRIFDTRHRLARSENLEAL